MVVFSDHIERSENLLGGTLQQICLILNYQEVEINQEEIE